MPYLALDGTFDINSVPDPLSGEQVLRFLMLPLLAYLCVILLRRAIHTARHPDCPPVWTCVFLGLAALCPLVWALGVHKVLPHGDFRDAVRALIALATLGGLAAGVWWCNLTRDHRYEPIPVAWQRY